MKAGILITLLGSIFISSAYASQGMQIECVTVDGQQMVKAIIDAETGDQSRFMHYALGKPSPSLISHFESDSVGTKGLEVYTQTPSGEFVAKLQIQKLREDRGMILGTGKLLVSHLGKNITKKDLTCSLVKINL